MWTCFFEPVLLLVHTGSGRFCEACSFFQTAWLLQGRMHACCVPALAVMIYDLDFFLWFTASGTRSTMDDAVIAFIGISRDEVSTTGFENCPQQGSIRVNLLLMAALPLFVDVSCLILD